MYVFIVLLSVTLSMFCVLRMTCTALMGHAA